ncbi:hypothetical protein Tco_1457000 [Tanacetum coccineum]
MTLVRSMASLTGGLEERNSTQSNKQKTVDPSDREASIADANSQCDPVSSIRKNTKQLPKKIILRRRADYQEYKISRKGISKISSKYFEDLLPTQNSRKASNHLPKTDKTSLSNSYKPLKRQIGMHPTITSMKDYTIDPKPRAICLQIQNDQRKFDELIELHKFSDGTFDKSNGKTGPMVKDFHLFEYKRAWETRKWSRMTREDAKTHHCIEKRPTDQRIYPKSRKLLLEKIKILTTGYQHNNSDDNLVTIKGTSEWRTMVFFTMKMEILARAKTKNPQPALVFITDILKMEIEMEIRSSSDIK